MIEIRSFRRVFDLERRIYGLEGLRLNPAGIPVRGVAYFVVILLMSVAGAHTPLLAAVASAVPWYVRDLALPVGAATVLSVIRLEGRPFHVAAAALLRHRMGARLLASGGTFRFDAWARPGARWYPGPIVILPDGSDGRMRRLRYSGPGAVLVSVSHRRWVGRRGPLDMLGARGPRMTLEALPGAQPHAGACVVVLERAACLRVR